MKKLILFIFLFSLILGFASAITVDDLNLIQQDIEENAGVSFSEIGIDDVVVVQGDGLNLVEKTAIDFAKKEYPELNDIKILNADEVSLEALESSGKTLIFIGGPSQNELVEEFLIDSNSTIKEYTLTAGAYSEGKIVLSDKRGFENLERKAVEHSPLRNLMPEEYVPAAAAGISVLLLILFELLTSYFEGLIENIKKGRKAIKEKFSGFFFMKIPIRFREILGLVLAGLVFALAMTWTFTGNSSNFFNVLGLATIICVGLFIIQEIPRMRFSSKNRTLTEFVFYPIGAAVTILSAFMGSVFGHPGRWMFQHKQHEGRVYYNMMVFTFILGIIFFIVNLLNPKLIFQLGFSITSTVSVFEMIPIKPLNGREIYKWKPVKWLITFIIFLPLYILMNFVL